MAGSCKICGRPHEGNAGDYYHDKDCEARSISKKLETVTDPKERIRLEKQREQARYVGD